MTLPLVLLAVLSTVGGLIGIPYALSSLPGVSSIVGKEANYFAATLDPVIVKYDQEKFKNVMPADVAAKKASYESHSSEAVFKERVLAVVSVALAMLGIGIGWFLFRGNPLRKLPKILVDKWRIDELYNGFIVDPLTRFSSNRLWKGFDVGFIDGMVNGAGAAVVALGGTARKIQGGFVRSYAAVILFGALLVIGFFIYYGFKLIG